MENQRFYLKITGAITSIVAASTVLFLNYSMKGPLAALFTLLAALLIKNAEKSSRKTGRTERMKKSLKASKEGGELLLISAGLVSYPASAAVTAAVIGFVSFSGTVEKNISDVDAFLGQETRIGLAILAFGGFYLNQYLLFYGFLAIGLVAVFDSAYMLYNSFNSVY